VRSRWRRKTRPGRRSLEKKYSAVQSSTSSLFRGQEPQTAFDGPGFCAHFIARMRVLQNCARRTFKSTSRIVEPLASQDAGGFAFRAGADRFQISAGEAVKTPGKVKFFNDTKGYGFFTRDDGSGDVFVHRTDLPAGIAGLFEGQAVTFDIERTSRGLRAVNIALPA
jgi:CspA family cold shock protein